MGSFVKSIFVNSPAARCKVCLMVCFIQKGRGVLEMIFFLEEVRSPWATLVLLAVTQALYQNNAV